MINLILIWQGRHRYTGLPCPQYSLFSRFAVTLETSGGESAFLPPILSKSPLPNSCLWVTSLDAIGCIFLSTLLDFCLFSRTFASFYFLVHSDILNLSSLERLVYLLLNVFLLWLSNNSTLLHVSFFLTSVVPLFLFSKPLKNHCLVLHFAKILETFLLHVMFIYQIQAAFMSCS